MEEGNSNSVPGDDTLFCVMCPPEDNLLPECEAHPCGMCGEHLCSNHAGKYSVGCMHDDHAWVCKSCHETRENYGCDSDGCDCDNQIPRTLFSRKHRLAVVEEYLTDDNWKRREGFDFDTTFPDGKYAGKRVISLVTNGDDISYVKWCGKQSERTARDFRPPDKNANREEFAKNWFKAWEKAIELCKVLAPLFDTIIDFEEALTLYDTNIPEQKTKEETEMFQELEKEILELAGSSKAFDKWHQEAKRFYTEMPLGEN